MRDSFDKYETSCLFKLLDTLMQGCESLNRVPLLLISLNKGDFYHGFDEVRRGLSCKARMRRRVGSRRERICQNGTIPSVLYLSVAGPL